MIHQETYSVSIAQSLLDSDTFWTDSQILKRKVSFSKSDNDYCSDENMITAKRRKTDVSIVSEDAENDFSGVSIESSSLYDSGDSDDSVSSSEQDNIFGWMDTILNGDTSEACIDCTTSSVSGNYSEHSDSKESTKGTDPLPTIDELDPFCDELISLLSQEDKDTDTDNIFKIIQESFISDRLLQHTPLSTIYESSNEDDIEKSPSSWKTNRNRIRFSRIEMKKCLEQLVTANQRSAKTRDMLLNCKLNLCVNQNQQ
mmetsp:Transcript_31164/g.73446  ORF Transcript_31164/g.73446 Transcript_31164/m.73446 type:complete len:257 (-) Transcript_31164:91-861(-)